MSYIDQHGRHVIGGTNATDGVILDQFGGLQLKTSYGNTTTIWLDVDGMADMIAALEAVRADMEAPQ